MLHRSPLGRHATCSPTTSIACAACSVFSVMLKKVLLGCRIYSTGTCPCSTSSSREAAAAARATVKPNPLTAPAERNVPNLTFICQDGSAYGRKTSRDACHKRIVYTQIFCVFEKKKKRDFTSRPRLVLADPVPNRRPHRH
jgi:hypothetical protein